MRVIVGLLALISAGCASTSQNLFNLPQERWEEEVRRRGVDLRDVPNPLMATPSMKEFAMKAAGLGTAPERLERLQRALFDEGTFPFSYENRGTFTAAEAFYRRQGNCLSFTNLFVALARSLDIPVSTAMVTRARGSEREGDLIVVNTHVIAVLSHGGGLDFYDFQQARTEQPRALRTLDDMWITSLYLNNRGAEELRVGRAEPARRLFADAVKLAPRFAGAWGNLGVASRRLGEITAALQAYAEALAIEPGNPTILTNLAALYRSLGKEVEANAALNAANLAIASPHVLLVRGDLELARGNVDQALRFYRDAKSRQPELVDAWLAMARAELSRGRQAKALSYLRKALKIDPENTQALAMQSRFAKRS